MCCTGLNTNMLSLWPQTWLESALQKQILGITTSCEFYFHCALSCSLFGNDVFLAVYHTWCWSFHCRNTLLTFTFVCYNEQLVLDVDGDEKHEGQRNKLQTTNLSKHNCFQPSSGRVLSFLLSSDDGFSFGKRRLLRKRKWWYSVKLISVSDLVESAVTVGWIEQALYYCYKLLRGSFLRNCTRITRLRWFKKAHDSSSMSPLFRRRWSFSPNSRYGLALV